jgi:hypothetical protein
MFWLVVSWVVVVAAIVAFFRGAERPSAEED